MPVPSAANIKGLVRAAIITLPVGIALFAGSIAAIAAKLVALGGVLMAAAVASLGIGCVIMIRVWYATRATVRDMRARQQADLAAMLRDQPDGGTRP